MAELGWTKCKVQMKRNKKKNGTRKTRGATRQRRRGTRRMKTNEYNEGQRRHGQWQQENPWEICVPGRPSKSCGTEMRTLLPPEPAAAGAWCTRGQFCCFEHSDAPNARLLSNDSQKEWHYWRITDKVTPVHFSTSKTCLNHLNWTAWLCLRSKQGLRWTKRSWSRSLNQLAAASAHHLPRPEIPTVLGATDWAEDGNPVGGKLRCSSGW